MTAQVAPFPVFRAFDSNGDPLAGGLLYTYAAGTTTPLATYTDQGGGTPNANPVVLDSTGTASVWYGSSAYKLVLKSSTGATMWTVDNFYASENLADLANTSDAGLGDALLGVKQPFSGAAALTQHTKNAQYINVKDFGAVGDGLTDDSAAFQNAVNAAMTSTGDLFVPAGSYLIGTTVVLGNLSSIISGLKIHGVTCNSIGKISQILQKDINTPVFRSVGISVEMTGLTFTPWSGSIYDHNGNRITVVSKTDTTITLSGNPWYGNSPVTWTPETPVIAYGGISYSTFINIAVYGNFLASGYTLNGDGTVTLTGVHAYLDSTGLNPDGSIANDTAIIRAMPIGSQVEYFVSGAQLVAEASYTSTTGMIWMDLRENQFFSNLWFNQCATCFIYDATGSGGGLNSGLGATGFMSRIVVDVCKFFIKSLGSITFLHLSDSQIITNSHALKAVDNINSTRITNCHFFVTGQVMYAGYGINGLTFVGNAINDQEGYGCPSNIFYAGAKVYNSVIADNIFGRTAGPAINFMDGCDGFSFTGNNIYSHSEGTNLGFFSFGGSVINSYFNANNFQSRTPSGGGASGALRMKFGNTSETITNSQFGPDVAFYTNHTGIGWIPVTSFSNSWANVGSGTQPVAYYKDLDNMVHIKGCLSGGASGTIAFVLPSGYRPVYGPMRHVAGACWNGSAQVPMLVDIAAAGNVTIQSTVAGWGHLDTVSFPAN